MSSATAKTATKSVAIEYNRAKIWQIALFVMNNTATNTAMLLLGYYAFYTQNVLGLAAVVVGLIATLMRVWDGITDPIIGYLLDKTNGRFGKFRPFMFIGNIIIISTMMIIHHRHHHLRHYHPGYYRFHRLPHKAALYDVEYLHPLM